MHDNKIFLQAVYNQPLLITDSEIGLLQASIQSALSNRQPTKRTAKKPQTSGQIDVEIFGATAGGNKRKKMYMGAGVNLYGESDSEREDDNYIQNGIAIINIKGMIMDFDGWWFECTSPRRIIDILHILGTDSRVLGVMLNVDSGGGAVPGVYELSELVRNYYRLYGKRVQASVERAGSAAYWIVSGADKIALNSPTASAGSIGAMTTFTNNTKMLADFGIVSTNVYATLSTLKNEDYEQGLKGNFKPVIDGMLDPINTEFLRGVSKGRYASKYSPEAMLAGTEETPDFLRGKMYYGSAAKDVGLVDTIMTMSAMLNSFYNAATGTTTGTTASDQIEPIDTPEVTPPDSTPIVFTSEANSQPIIKLKRLSDIFTKPI